MENTMLRVIEGENFAGVEVGELVELDRYQFFHPLAKGRGFPGKLFLKAPLKMTGMEVSMNKLPAGGSMPFFHEHKEHEELYIFLRGQGQFLVDGTVIPVQQGTVIRVSPKGKRTWRNPAQEELIYIVVQAKANSMQETEIEDGVVCRDPVVWPA